MAIKQRLELDSTQYRQKLREAERSLEQFSKQSGRHGKSISSAVKDGAEEAERSWSKAGRSIESSMGRVKAAIVAVFSVELVRRFLTGLVGVNRELEDAQTRLAAVVGEQRAPALFKQIQAFAAKTPFELAEVTTAFALLAGAGLDANEAIQTVANTAAGTGKNLIDVSKATADAMKGEVDRLKDLDTSVRMSGDSALEYLDKLSGKMKTVSFTGPRGGADFQRALTQALGAAYEGAAERMSQTFSGRLSTLTDNLKIKFADLGKDLFREMTGDLQSLNVSIEQMGQSTTFKRTMQDMARSLADVYRLLRSITVATKDYIPAILRLGAAFVSLKAAVAVLGALRTGFSRLAAGSKGVLSFYNPKNVRADFYKWANAANIVAEGRADFDRLEGLKTTALRGQEFAKAAALRDQQAAVDKQIQKATRSMAELEAKGITMGRRVGNSFKRLASQVFTLRNALNFAAIYLALRNSIPGVAQAVDTITNRLRDQAAVIRELATSIATLDDAAAGASQIAVNRHAEDAEKRMHELAPRLPEGMAQAINRLSRDEMEQLSGRFSDFSILGVDVEKDLTAVSRWWRGLFGGSQPGRLFDEFRAGALSGFELTTSAQVRDAQEFVALAMQRRDLGQAQHEIEERIAGSLHAELGLLEAQQQLLVGKKDRTAQDEADLQALNQRIEEIRKLIAQAEGLNLSTTLAGPADPKADPMSLMELEHAIALLRTRAELREQLQDIQQTETELLQLQTERAALESGDSRRAQYDELIRLKEQERTTEQKAYDLAKARLQQAEDMNRIYGMLTEQERAFVDELGGLEAFFKQGFTTEDLDVFTPLMDRLTTFSSDLAAELQDIQNRLDLGEIGEQTAQELAAAAGDRYRQLVLDVIEEIRASAMPGPLKDALQEIINTISGQIGGTKLKEVEEETKDIGKNLMNLARSGRTLLNLGQAFGTLSDNVSNFADGILDAVDNLGALKDIQQDIATQNKTRAAAGQAALSGADKMLMELPSYVGIIAGVGTAIAGMISATAQEHEQRREEMKAYIESLADLRVRVEDNVRALNRNTEAVLSQSVVGADVTQEQINSAQGVWDQLTGSILNSMFGSYTNLTEEQIRGMLGLLEESGIGVFEGIRDYFDTAMEGVEINKPYGMARILMELFGELLGPWNQFKEAVGQFGESFDGLIRELEIRKDGLGQSLDELSAVLLARLDTFEIDDVVKDHIRSALEGINLNTPEGQKALHELLLSLSRSLVGEGPFNLDDLLDTSFTDIESLIRALEMFVSEGSEGEEWTKSVSYLRQITQAQGEEMVLLLREIAYFIRAIAEQAGAVTVPTVTVPGTNWGGGYSRPGAAPAVQQFNTSVGNVSVPSEAALRALVMTEIEKAIRQKSRSGFFTR